MSVLRRMLTRVGIGGISVDTILEKDSYVIGEQLSGIVNIEGSSMKQTIDGIYLTLSIKFVRKLRKRKIYTRFDLHRVKIADKFILQSNEKKEIPFSFEIPLDTPITLENDLVWVHTNLDIKNAIDPVDVDYVKIKPDEKMTNIINEIENAGFSLNKVELNESPEKYKFRHPFVQEVSFLPNKKGNNIESLNMIPLNNEEFSIEFVHNSESKSFIVNQSNEKSIKNEISQYMKDFS